MFKRLWILIIIMVMLGVFATSTMAIDKGGEISFTYNNGSGIESLEIGHMEIVTNLWLKLNSDFAIGTELSFARSDFYDWGGCSIYVLWTISSDLSLKLAYTKLVEVPLPIPGFENLDRESNSWFSLTAKYIIF